MRNDFIRFPIILLVLLMLLCGCVTPPEREIAEFIQRLGVEEEEVRDVAVKALLQFGQPAVKQLIEVLRNEDSSLLMRLGATEALGLIGDNNATQPLIETLANRWSAIRMRSAKALGRIGDSKAVLPLINGLQDTEPVVRVCAAEALCQIGDERAIPHFLEALKHDSETDRRWASHALRELHDETAIQPLIQILNDEVLEVREFAVETLAAIGQPTVALLIEVLSDTKKDVITRSRAAQVLGQIGGKEVLQPLGQALKDDDVNVRQYAIIALRKIGGTAVVRLLIGGLKHECLLARSADRQGNERDDAYEVSPLKGLVKLAGGHGYTCMMYRRALSELGELAVQPLVEELRLSEVRTRLKESDVCAHVTLTLNEIGVPAIRFLIKMLRDGNPVAQLHAEFTLAAMGESTVALLLETLKDDKSTHVHAPIARILAHISAKKALPRLRELSEKGETEDIRREAENAIKSIE